MTCTWHWNTNLFITSPMCACPTPVIIAPVNQVGNNLSYVYIMTTYVTNQLVSENYLCNCWFSHKTCMEYLEIVINALKRVGIRRVQPERLQSPVWLLSGRNVVWVCLLCTQQGFHQYLCSWFILTNFIMNAAFQITYSDPALFLFYFWIIVQYSVS